MRKRIDKNYTKLFMQDSKSKFMKFFFEQAQVKKELYNVCVFVCQKLERYKFLEAVEK